MTGLAANGRDAAATSGHRGRLDIYLGSAPGAGKTFAMLAEAQHLRERGIDAVVGLVETHGRTDTETMLATLEQVAPRQVRYRGAVFAELDVDAILARHPSVVMVDELAHTCVPVGRHDKRWEDVEELRDAGIDVVTTLNVQHVDGLHDTVEWLTGVNQRETVPDAVVATADRIELIDIAPEQLRARIAASDLVGGGSTESALSGFFTEDRLRALRELALSWLEDHGLFRASSFGDVRAAARGRVVVALTGAPEGEHVVRRAARLAAAEHAELIGVHVSEPTGLITEPPAWLARQRRMLSELGGRYAELGATDVATTVLDFARREGAGHLVLGSTRRSRRDELLHGSVINRAIRAAGQIEVHVVPARQAPRSIEAAGPVTPPPRRVTLPAQRRFAAWLLAVAGPAVVVIGLTPLRDSLGLAGALLCALVTVVGVALLGGIWPALLATVVALLLSDFYYTVPFHSLRVDRLVDVVALVTFGLVAAAVGMLVAVVTRQGVTVTRANADAENLARLAGETLAFPRDLTLAVDAIREVFDLDGVAVLCKHADEWKVEAAAGTTVIDRPDCADYQAEVTRDRVLAIAGRGVSDLEAGLLRAFVDQVRLAHQRSVLDTLENDEMSDRDGQA